jgi:hypothetical protein
MGGAISHPHGELQRLLLLAMSELPDVHKETSKIAHHTHTAAAQLLADKEVAEGDDARECRGEGIHPRRTLLPGNSSPQRGGGRRSQRHWDGRRWHILVTPSRALLLCSLPPT